MKEHFRLSVLYSRMIIVMAEEWIKSMWKKVIKSKDKKCKGCQCE